MMDHRAPTEVSRQEEKYLPAHSVEFVKGRLLHRIAQKYGLNEQSVQVNSLHVQGIEALGKGLEAEAHSLDGLVEAVSIRRGSGFALGVQWHPEWYLEDNPLNAAIFAEFRTACIARMQADLFQD